MQSKPSTRLLRLLTIVSPVLFLLGCFGEGDGKEPIRATAIPPVTGILVDSPVSGAGYETSGGESGITNEQGGFSYVPGNTVTFSVGGIVLGSALGAPIISAVELTGSNNPTDQAAINQFVFLQSIDEDQDPTNGISISGSTQSAAAGQSLNFFDPDFRTAVAAVVAAIAPGNRVVSDIDALAHFYRTFANLGGTDTFSFSFPGFPPTRSGVTYELVFADEFNEGTAPNPDTWNYDLGYGSNGWGNNEWQEYTDSPDNVRVEDGNLVIEALCETPGSCGVRDGSITSGRITTKDKFEFRYGTIIARIKPPVGDGAWPAFWALGAAFPETSWPRVGEIDFMEMHNASDDSNEGTANFTMHWCDETVNPSLPSTAVCYPQQNGWIFDRQFRQFNGSLGDDYQLFEADWDEDRIIGRINGITFFERQIDPATMEEFLGEFFTILNVAMGGTLGSGIDSMNMPVPPADFYAQDGREEVWPQTMLVDYVRVFQRTDAPTQGLNIDFEEPASQYTFANFGGSDAGQGGRGAVVANPAPEGINTSAQVGQVQKFAGELFAGTTLVTAFDVPAQNAFTMKVWSPRAVNVLFKLEGITPVAETEVAHSGSGWEELTFNLGAFSGTATGITFIFDNGTLGNADTAPADWTFYIDDISRALILTQIDLPITFDEPTVDYTLIDFGDPAAITTLVDDPDSAGNTVASTTKPMMAQDSAGTTMSTEAGLASTIPFSANQTTIGVRVYSPAAGVPVRLKADDVVNGSVSVETELLTTVANEWETLVFDFSSQADGTAALDLDTDYTALSIFFDFGTVGNGATYLWDDVEFGVPVPDTTAPTLTTVSIASSNADPALATTGDVVTVTLTADESIMSSPTVLIGNIAATVNGGGADWEASRMLTDDDTDGVVTFSIEFTDLAGNAGTAVSATTDDSSVTLDATAPTFAIVVESMTFTTLAPIAVTFEFSEGVTGFTVDDIQNNLVNGAVSAFTSSNAARYTANIVPRSGLSDLIIAVTAGVANDAAGNANLAAGSITIEPDFEPDEPLLTNVSISSSSANGYARTGDVVTIDMTATEAILLPTVTIAGAPATVEGGGTTTTWSASRTMLATDTEGEIGFTIDYEDLTNNAGPQHTATTDESSVIFDITAPTLSIENVVDVLTTDPFMATFQFNEDVTGFTVDGITVTNGTRDQFASVDAATYTAMITPTEEGGALTVSVAADAATDLAGNGSEAASVTVSVDLGTPFWKVVWSDEFDGTALNPANWTARTDDDCPDPCNGVQSYSAGQVSVGAGFLTITADSSGPITSGLIDTRGSELQLQRGRVEIDVKMPPVTGSIIPSLRMLPADSDYGPWPQSGEIDIINSPAALLTEHTLVYGLPEPEETTATVSGGLLPGTASTAFLTYAIEWEADEIRWFVNGTHKASQIPDNWYAYGEDEDGVYTLGAGAAPFDRDFYILIGLTVDAAPASDLQILQVNAVRVYECANGDPETGTGCEGLIDPVDPAITPIVVTDEPYNGAPYTEELEVYTDVPATLDFIDGAGMTTSGALIPAPFNDPGVGVISMINADDGGNTVWNAAISAGAGSGGVLMGPADFGVRTGFFDLTGGGTAGELLFRMRVNSASNDPQLQVKLDSETGSGVATLDYTADGMWRQYSVKISDMVTGSVMRGSTLDLADLVNVFAIQAVGGDVNIDLDDISVKVACREPGGCEATPRIGGAPPVEEYFQNFESMEPAEGPPPNSLSADLWVVFGAVFDPSDNFLYGYGTFEAPNGGPGFSGIVDDQGGTDQGTRQLSIYTNYDDPVPHEDGNFVEASVFRERFITSDDVGKLITFSFDAKGGNIEGASTANGFIKTIDPNDGFNQTNLETVDTTNIPDTWQRYEVSLEIDEGLVDQLLQVGFASKATNFEGSTNYYDNVLVTGTAL